MKTVSEYFRDMLGRRAQKIAVDAGLGCPNRDGTLSTGGCMYCSNAAFSPAYAAGSGHSIIRQLEDGRRFFAGKTGEDTAFLAYFQSWTNTYGDTEKLIRLYEEALSCPGIEGLVIATRPDCLKEDLTDWFAERISGKGSPFLLVELGVESTKDETLRRINRGHDFACARRAVLRLAAKDIPVGVHMILGLPGETQEDYDIHARRINGLPISTLKLHQLQVIKGTGLERIYREDPSCLTIFTPESYAEAAARFVSMLRGDIALDRLVSEAPPSMLIAPHWGLKPDIITSMIEKKICTTTNTKSSIPTGR